ncbi:34463_t:CDS:1, partial [Racocetra persica]
NSYIREPCENEIIHNNNEHEDQVKELKKKNKEMQLKIDELDKQVNHLTIEAARHQSALGRAIKDNDLSNISQLRNDIDVLKQNLEEFCMVKPADDFDIDLNAATNLLEKCASVKAFRDNNNYVSSIAYVLDEEHLKTLVHGALQRLVIESVIRHVKYLGEYLGNLEVNIINQTDDLLNVLNNLINSRVGNDDISRIMPTRLRQQVYSILDNRGFNPIKIKNITTEHPFISIFKEEIMSAINEIRVIKNCDKLKRINDMAAELIRDIIKIFFFRLKIQEQVADPLHWFKFNDPVNLSLMEGAFGSDDRHDMVVQICTFPLITVSNKKHVVARANVHVITKNNIEP